VLPSGGAGFVKKVSFKVFAGRFYEEMGML
jgi:hypothetical protein